MPLISVAAADIDRAGVSIDAELPVAWLDQELADADVRGQLPGRVRARLSRSGTEVVVRGRVAAKVSVPCARCLDPAPIDIDAELALLLRPDPSLLPSAQKKAAKAAETPAAATKGSSHKRGAAREPEYEFTAEEAELDRYDGETVVLDEFIREAILLEMPPFPLCSEACPGIAVNAANEPLAPAAVEAPPALDPRLAPLEQIKARLARTEVAIRTMPSAGRDRPARKKKRPAKPVKTANKGPAKRKSR